MGMGWMALVSGQDVQTKTSWHNSEGPEDRSELDIFLWPGATCPVTRL